MTRLFGLSRYLVLIAVLGLLFSALAVFIFGGITAVHMIIETFETGEYNALGARVVSVEFVELIDVFLLGTILIITSVGLYQLFINSEMDLPEWLVVTTIDQLKLNLLAVIVVMLAVLFLSEAAADLANTDSIALYGLAIAAVIASVALAVWVFQRVVSAEEKEIHQTILEAQQEDEDDDNEIS